MNEILHYLLILSLFAEMAPKTKGDAKPKADKKEKKPAPKKVEASKKETKDGKAPVKAVQKALKVSALWHRNECILWRFNVTGPEEGGEGCSWNQSEEGQN